MVFGWDSFWKGPRMDIHDPWFRDGLRFECTQCGDCCTGEPGYVWVNDKEIKEIAKFLGTSETEVREYYGRKDYKGITLREKANGDCIFFARGQGCTIYAVRPTQCRTWPFWRGNVDTKEDWKKTCEICPGSGKGKLISAEEILKRVFNTKV